MGVSKPRTAPTTTTTTTTERAAFSAGAGGSAVANLLDEQCGRPAQQFVFGGELAEKGAFPYMVSFVNVYGDEVGNTHEFFGHMTFT